MLGRELLDAEGLPAHALVCERHIGVGLTVQDIVEQQLSLPERNMEPVTMAERIICFADLFYSKRLGSIHCEKTVEQVRKNLLKHGEQKIALFEKWLEEFSG